MNNKTNHRRQLITEMINIEGKVYVNELATHFNVSQETIRTDLNAIEKSYPIERFHGGAERINQHKYKQSLKFNEKAITNQEIKMEISKKASSYIEDGDYIFIDSGSTATFLIDYMYEVKNVTLVTASISLLLRYLSNNTSETFKHFNHKLIFIGGEIEERLHSTYGDLFYRNIKDFNFDKMFFSCDGISLSGGVSNADYPSYNIAQSVIPNATQKILLVDSSKFGRVCNLKISDFRALDAIITDYVFDNQWSDQLLSNNVTPVVIEAQNT